MWLRKYFVCCLYEKHYIKNSSTELQYSSENNFSLIDGDSQSLKEHLIDELDYILLPTEGWNRLVSWYTLMEGQEPIARKVLFNYLLRWIWFRWSPANMQELHRNLWTDFKSWRIILIQTNPALVAYWYLIFIQIFEA